MWLKTITFFVLISTLTLVSTQAYSDGEKENVFSEAASAILQEAGNANVDWGSMLGTLMQSEIGKNMGNMFMQAASSPDSTNQILSGIASILANNDNKKSNNQQQDSQNGGLQIDPMMLLNLVSLFTNNAVEQQQQQQLPESQPGQQKSSASTGLDFLSSVIGFLNNQQNLDMIQGLLSSFGGFSGEEAEEREKDHASHAWVLPPFIERLHVMFDHFMNSDFMKEVIEISGVDKFMKTFTNDRGQFDMSKFVDRMENHNFRKHWIKRATYKVGMVFSFVFDPILQKRYMKSISQAGNDALRKFEYPKHIILDTSRPAESLSDIADYSFKKYLGLKVNSKKYVKPIVIYIQGLIKEVHRKNLANNPDLVSDQLADVLNLELIEPVLRSYRAYRFASKQPTCGVYVMCLINDDHGPAIALPGVRRALSKGVSLATSLLLSFKTNNTFNNLYAVIVNKQNGKCSKYYRDECHDFHIAEEKVTQPYVHSEL